MKCVWHGACPEPPAAPSLPSYSQAAATHLQPSLSSHTCILHSSPSHNTHSHTSHFFTLSFLTLTYPTLPCLPLSFPTLSLHSTFIQTLSYVHLRILQTLISYTFLLHVHDVIHLGSRIFVHPLMLSGSTKSLHFLFVSFIRYISHT